MEVTCAVCELDQVLGGVLWWGRGWVKVNTSSEWKEEIVKKCAKKPANTSRCDCSNL